MARKFLESAMVDDDVANCRWRVECVCWLVVGEGGRKAAERGIL